MFAFHDANPHHEKYGEGKEIPLPWDAVFLGRWTAFIQQMGKRYSQNPHVVMVQMAAGNQSGSEMHLPSKGPDRDRWLAMGYTREKLIASYRQVIDAYAAAFPSTQLGLNVSRTIFDDGAEDEIAAYAFQKLGRRFCIQHNALHATTSDDFHSQQLVSSYAGKATVGFQLLSSATGKGRFNEGGKRFGGSLATAFDIGLRAGASYFEVYPQDLEDSGAASDIQALFMQLRN
jgi:hypothetical protein